MPIEVYIIEGPYISINPPGERKPKAVAEEIKQTYEKVVAAGGSIVASHTIDQGFRNSGESYGGNNYLYIVARMP